MVSWKLSRSKNSLEDVEREQFIKTSSEETLRPADEGHALPRPPTSRALLVLSVVLILTLSHGLVFSLGFWKRSGLDRACMERSSTYSPVLKDLDVKLYPTKFDGSIESSSIYKGEPSPELDEAWDRLEEVNVMNVPEEQAMKSGIDPDGVRLPPEFGGGFMAAVEVNHQLHCVNMVRKATYFDYYKNRTAEFSDPPEIMRKHIDHCLNMIRQVVQCNSDVGLIGMRWVANFPGPYPDFSTTHRCRNFDQVLDWAVEHALPHQPPGFKWPILPGSKIFEHAP